MAEEKKKEEEFIRINVMWRVDMRLAAGPYLSKYLLELRDRGKIWATRCPKCGIWKLPPSIVCAQCHVKIPEFPEGWVELSGKGYLDSWYKVVTPQMNLRGETKPEPYVQGSIRLDEGPSIGCYLNIPTESEDADKLKRGMRCELELKPINERRGLSDDIKWAKVLWDEPIKELEAPKPEG